VFSSITVEGVQKGKEGGKNHKKGGRENGAYSGHHPPSIIAVRPSLLGQQGGERRGKGGKGGGKGDFLKNEKKGREKEENSWHRFPGYHCLMHYLLFP